MVANPNLLAGWSLVLAGFVSGAALGVGFHRPDFLGGYGSLRRRLLRLGHIACVALGMLNLLFVTTCPPDELRMEQLPGSLLIAGSIAMPLSCWLAAWRPSLRLLFVVPVATLVAAVVCVLVLIRISGPFPPGGSS